MTVDLGRIKIVWQGTYAGGTTYKKDDAVFYNGSSYICTAATSTGNTPASNSAFWNLMVQGSDVVFNLDVATISGSQLVFPTTGNVINVIDNGTGAAVTITSVSNVTAGVLYKIYNSRTSVTSNFTLSAVGNIFGSTTTIASNVTPTSPGAVLALGVASTSIRVI